MTNGTNEVLCACSDSCAKDGEITRLTRELAESRAALLAMTSFRDGLLVIEAQKDAENERLRAAVLDAVPWLDDLRHAGTLVDQRRRAATAAKLRAALGVEQQARPK